MLSPYIKSRGTGGTKMSANTDLITVETDVQGKTIENQFFWAYLAYQLSIHPYLSTCEIRKQSDQNFLSSNTKYEEEKIIWVEGLLVALMSNPGLPNFQSSTRPHLRADKCITREITTSFFIYAPQCEKRAFLAIRGGGGGTIICLVHQHIYLLSDIIFLYQVQYEILGFRVADFCVYLLMK